MISFQLLKFPLNEFAIREIVISYNRKLSREAPERWCRVQDSADHSLENLAKVAPNLINQ